MVASARASASALMTSLIRAVHTRCDQPVIFDDPFGDRFLAAEERAPLLERLLLMLGPEQREQVQRASDPSQALDIALRLNPAYAGVVVRSRYCEDELLRAVGSGVRQYVLLGAGLDTFALRRREVAAGLAVFEIDTPDAQAMKRRRLAAAGLRLPNGVHLIAADLETDTVADALAGSAYDAARPAFVACLGVTPYLSTSAILAMLHSLSGCAAPLSELVFDYLDADAFAPQRADAAMRRIAAERATSGEPWRSGLDPPQLARDLGEAGWTLLQDLDADALQLRYGERLAMPRHMHLSHARVAAR